MPSTSHKTKTRQQRRQLLTPSSVDNVLSTEEQTKTIYVVPSKGPYKRRPTGAAIGRYDDATSVCMHERMHTQRMHALSRIGGTDRALSVNTQ